MKLFLEYMNIVLNEKSQMMASVKSKNTVPEMAVRSLLHRLGLGFVFTVTNYPVVRVLCPSNIIHFLSTDAFDINRKDVSRQYGRSHERHSGMRSLIVI